MIGWIGSHSTSQYLRTLLPVFAAEHVSRLRIVGSSRLEFSSSGVTLDMRPWRMDREVEDLQSFDIAVYPLIHDDWVQGKSGLKAIQCLSCGIPYVASPLGVVAGIGVPGLTHLETTTEREWLRALSHLLADPGARRDMGREGRDYAVANYSTANAATTLATILRKASEGKL